MPAYPIFFFNLKDGLDLDKIKSLKLKSAIIFDQLRCIISHLLYFQFY